MTDSISAHKDSAEYYDQAARDYEWHGHELIFGMCSEYLLKGGRMLDVGIGTGLSSELFAQAGMDIIGHDGSAEMLKQCEKKGIARELILHDLTKIPWPIETRSFDFVISIGVFHFFEDLQPFMNEASRALKPKGIFAFTVADPNQFSQQHTEPVKQIMEGASVYAHPVSWVNRLLADSDFTKLKSAGVLTKMSLEKPDEMLYRAIVAQKRN